MTEPPKGAKRGAPEGFVGFGTFCQPGVWKFSFFRKAHDFARSTTGFALFDYQNAWEFRCQFARLIRLEAVVPVQVPQRGRAIVLLDD